MKGETSVDQPYIVKLTMDLSEEPGSPRKKFKYDAAFLDGSAMDISGIDENVTPLEDNIVPPLNTMDHTLQTEAQHKPSNTSNHHSLLATKASNDSAAELTGLIPTTEPANNQSNKEKACGITEFGQLQRPRVSAGS